MAIETTIKEADDRLVIHDTARAVKPSAVQYKVGGRYYTMKSVPQCFTCQSQHRQEIEASILNGYGYGAIVAGLPKDSKLTEKHIGDHVRNNHLPIGQTIRQKIIENRSRELGKRLDELTDTAVDHVVFARMGIQKTFEAMMQNDSVPSIAEATQMAALLAKIEQNTHATDVDNYAVMQGFATMLEIVRAMLTPQQFREFGMKLGGTPFLRSLMNSNTAVIDLPGEEDDDQA